MRQTVNRLLILVIVVVALGQIPVGAQPVAWIEMGNINIEHGLSLMNTGISQSIPATVEGSKCRKNDLEATPPSYCFCFDLDTELIPIVRPVYVTIEYFDKGFGTINLQYDSADLKAPEKGTYKSTGVELLLDSQKWRQFTFALTDARFDGRQELDADFRLIVSGEVAIRKVSVEMERSDSFNAQPESWKDRVALSAGKLNATKGFHVTFSGVEAAYSEDLPAALEQMRILAPVLKILGATSVESYVKWRSVETVKGKWDWSYYDQLVAILRENGLKWNPYIMVGPAYATPEWFASSDESLYAKCLEHRQETRVQSIWNPKLAVTVDGFVRAFASHYATSKHIESILLGVSGDVGEAMYPVTTGGWTSISTGDYHTHAGFWCADKHAEADFQRQMQSLYPTIDALNAAWESSYKGFDQVKPFLPQSTKSVRARLDFIKWYRGSMTKWAETCIEIVRERFPSTAIYLCTGGDGQPAHGTDFSVQCRIAGRHGAGIRLTNESSSYPINFANTRLMATACNHYGVKLDFESTNNMAPAGITSRIYNAATSGCEGIHVYYPIVLTQAGGVDKWSESFKWLGTKLARKPKIAVFFPQTTLTLNWGGFYDKLMQLRDSFEFDVMDEALVRDGALKDYRVFVIPYCTVMEKEDIQIIHNWVEGGGIAIACKDSQFRTVDGDKSAFEIVFDASPDASLAGKPHGLGLSIYIPQGWGGKSNVVKSFSDALDSLSTRVRANLVPDGVEDGVYITDIGNGLLIYNASGANVDKDIQIGIGEHRRMPLAAGRIQLQNR